MKMEKIAELEGYKYTETTMLGKWYVIDGYCLCRCKPHGDPHLIVDRIAFMEKSMRIRLHKYMFSLECSDGIGAYGQGCDSWLTVGRGSVYEQGDFDEELLQKTDHILEILY